MLLELKLENWLKAGLALYKAQPLLTELVFADDSQRGFPTALAAGLLVDTTQRWLPDEFTGGVLRWTETLFPILSNTTTTLTLTGDPSVLDDVDAIGYAIVPPAALALAELLATREFVVTTAFTHVPTELPAFVIRLQSDAQGQPYIDEMVDNYVPVLTGVEHSINRADMIGSYLISIWTTNRLEALWLYAWLHNYALASIQMFASWGLYDVAFSGSDLDPALQYLPERGYVRHFLLTATRPERALTLATLERVTDLLVTVDVHYARLRETFPLP
jgi:hypothetical protein